MLSGRKAIGLDGLARHVAQPLDMRFEDLLRKGQYQQRDYARNLLCYWMLRELGESMTTMVRCLKIATAELSKPFRRNAAIVE